MQGEYILYFLLSNKVKDRMWKYIYIFRVHLLKEYFVAIYTLKDTPW